MKFIVLFILTFNFAVAQKAKKEYIVDENNQTVTFEQFKQKMDSENYVYSVNEKDTFLIATIVPRVKLGQMTMEDRAAIRLALQEITPTQISANQTLIINFFLFNPTEGETGGVHHYSKDTNFKRKAKRKKITQFFVAEKGFKPNKNTVEDVNGKIQSLIFPHNFLYNYIIIKPDGKFHLQTSEYRQDEIFDNLEKLK